MMASAQDGLANFQTGGRVRRILDPEHVKLRGPAVILTDPKFPHNVGQTIRMCACYGIETLITSGYRVDLDSGKGAARLPREERMRAYKDVRLCNYNRPFDLFPKGSATFVAVEVRDNAESLPFFEHPADAVYVFGPEDGSLGRQTLGQCSRFVVLPTAFCLNLSAAVGTVLYDRLAKATRLSAQDTSLAHVEVPGKHSK